MVVFGASFVTLSLILQVFVAITILIAITGCGKCVRRKSAYDNCLSEFDHEVRHELEKMALEEEQPGEALLKYLWKNYGSSRLADDQIIW